MIQPIANEEDRDWCARLMSSNDIQSICVAADARGRGIGTRAIAWAEDRIFRESPNVFICVSSFNPDARRLYERLGYEVVGVLKGFVGDEHDKVLLRKRRGSWDWFRSRFFSKI